MPFAKGTAKGNSAGEDGNTVVLPKVLKRTVMGRWSEFRPLKGLLPGKLMARWIQSHLPKGVFREKLI